MAIILDDVASRCDFCITKLNILKYLMMNCYIELIVNKTLNLNF